MSFSHFPSSSYAIAGSELRQSAWGMLAQRQGRYAFRFLQCISFWQRSLGPAYASLTPEYYEYGRNHSVVMPTWTPSVCTIVLALLGGTKHIVSLQVVIINM